MKAMNLTFKSGLRFVACLLLVLTSSKCEDDEAPLQFDVIDNSAPDVTSVSYYCPDMGPFGGVMEYFVRTDFSESSVKLYCNNCGRDGIRIETSLSKPCVLENGGSSSCEATPEETGIYVSLSDANTITVNFAGIDREDLAYAYYGTITAYGKVNRKDVKTQINISRSNLKLPE